MDEHVLEAYIINASRHTEQSPVAEWVPLPTDAEKMKAVFDRLGIDGGDPEQYAVTGYASPADGLAEHLKPGESLDELNYLAALLTRQHDEDRDKLAAAVIHGDHAGSLQDIINLTHNLDCYWLYPTVHNTEDYGYYLIDTLDDLELPEAAKQYFDYKAYGRDAVREDGGSFTDYGYIYNNKNNFNVWYEGRDVPEEYRITPQQPTRPNPEKMDMDAIGTRQAAILTAQPPEPQPVKPLVLTGQNNAERMKEITDKLEAGIQALFSSEQYADYLKAMSKFHNYSFNNTLLIVMQKPDASLIAGFNKWKDKFDRNVKKGEKGIKILAPAPFKVKKEMERIDPQTQRPVVGRDGKPVTEEVEVTVPAFKPVTVFDVSQTEGKELPDIAVDVLTGDVEQYKDFFAALEKTSPVPMAFEKIDSGANGYYHQEEKRIAIQEGISELQTVKTAIHEIAHAKLHAIDKDAPNEEQRPKIDRRTREVQAESVAYAVCQHYGLDTSDYSFGYVAGWSGGKEVAELKASLETIRAAASELITEIDGHFAELQQQREAAAPIMDKASPEQRQALDDEVRKTLQMFVDDDMNAHGQLTQGTLDAIAVQGYAYQDGQLVKAQTAPEYEYRMHSNPRTIGEENRSFIQAYEKKDGQLVPDKVVFIGTPDEARQRLDELIGSTAPDVIAADLFDLMRDFDPAFMQKYAGERDKQVALSAESLKSNDTFHMEAILLNIVQDGGTEEIRQRAAALTARLDAFKEQNNTYSIYQLIGGAETRSYRFEPLDRLQAAGLAVDRGNYDLVYTAPLSDIDTLEDIYRRFNLDHPKDFTGHSLSVSDVVVLRHGDKQTAHYCDSYGFREVPQFLQERQREKENPLKTAELSTEQNENMIDGRINNTPSVGELEAKVKAGETISLSDLAAAVKNEGKAERGRQQKKPSIRAQLRPDKDAAARKQEARNKNLEREV